MARFSNKTVIVIGALVIIALLVQANIFAWKYHLQVDVDGQYFSIARAFADDLSLKNLGYNEYLPGAVLFFTLLSPVLAFSQNPEHFHLFLFSINILLIVALALIYKKAVGNIGVLTFLLLLFAGGPIIFYRFELYISLVLILSLFIWSKGKEGLSFFLLGVGASIKIFPVLLLPYFLFLSMKKHGLKKTLSNLFLFLTGALTPIFIYLSLNGSIPSIKSALEIHAKKPVHIESIWATLLTLHSKFSTGLYAQGQGEWGIFGIAKAATIGPLFFYNYFWVVALFIVYVFVWRKIRQGEPYSHLMAAVIILIFLITSKILTGQYLYWLALVFPLIVPVKKTWWKITLIVIVEVFLITQFIYPLHYNELLGCFYQVGACEEYFWILALRNSLLVVLAAILAKQTLWKKL